MRGIFDPQNTFWRTVAFVCDFVGLSLCWLLCCIPIVTSGAATCALYDAVYRGLRTGEEIRVYGRFFSTFKRELKTGVLATLPFLLLGAVYAIFWRVAFLVAIGGNDFAGALVYAYQVVFCIPVMVWAVAMATLSRFTFKTKELLGTACKLVFSDLPMAIAVAVILAVGLKLMSWWFISGIFAPALMAYLCSFPVEKIFAPFLPEEAEDEYDEE